ncbi:LOW QUALITY PROTEIN: signal peptide peptidase-like 2C [Tamandua tetradactyla]|uniref:LOW QUALITY PROTEIN: signal peptide peptidase-like 2C n=1 Tax=Tamandua tetradactyla TaxID=48850 RepID=UPI0040545683
MARLGSLLPLGFLLLLANTMARGEYGVAHVVSGTWSKDYCILFSSDYVNLPRDARHAPLLPLHDGTAASWCPGEDAFPPPPPRGRTAMVLRGNCSFLAKGWLAQARGALGLLIVSRVGDQQCSDITPARQDPRRPRRPPPALAIPVAMLRYADMLDILSHTRGAAAVRVALYAPPEPLLDYSLAVIFVLAVGTVAVGGYWAGLTEADRLRRRRARGGGGPGGRDPPGPGVAGGGPEEEGDVAPVDFTPAMTGAVVTLSCCIMLLLYFFYDCFVYGMIGIFGLGAGTGLYSCLAPLVRPRPPPRPQGPPPGRRAWLRPPPPLLAGLCALVTALWVAFRNEDRWAWLLQDLLGVAYCLFVLRHVRLPTLRNCTSFLLALLTFDVFFVFVTPLLTRTGESIMVEVASGPANSSSLERLPMVLKVPRMSFSALTLCDQPFSILGFGDLVVPGFLVAYCRRFDIQVHSRQVYFVACTVAYAVGLVVTFVAMIIMQMGQPALLYLVSCTLLTSLAVAACRQELTLFWTGQGRAKPPAVGLHSPLPAGSEERQEDAAGAQAASKSGGAADQGAGDLDSRPGEEATETVAIPKDEASGQDGHSESSEGWSDANLDPDELPTVSPRASEELTPSTPVAMLIPLMSQMPPSSELGHTQGHDASLPGPGLHKRKGLKLKKSMSTQAPL